MASENTLEEFKQSETSMFIYPNPNDGRFTISVEGQLSEQARIMVYNNVGKLVYNSRFTSSVNSKQQLNLSDLPTGLYFVNVLSESKMITRKIIIE